MKPRTWLLLLLLVLPAGCDSLFGPDPVPSELVIISGDGQVDVVGATLSGVLVVELLDDGGDPYSGAAVTWTVPTGDAVVIDRSGDTDEDGRAWATVRLGTVADASAIEARVEEDIAVRFDVTATPDRPAVVEPSADSVVLDALGDSTQVGATVFDRYGNEIPDPTLQWSVEDTLVAAATGSGVVRSTGPGATTLTIRSDTASGGVRVVVVQLPDSVAVTPTEALLTAIEDTALFGAVAFDRNGFEIDEPSFEWSSEAPDIATVDGDGVVTAAGQGEAVITTGIGGVTATATVRVEQAVARVELAAPGDTLREPGDTLVLQATAFDRNDHAVPDAEMAWESSRTGIATVDEAGVVKAGYGRGDTRITVTSEGQSASRVVSRIPFGVLVLTFDDIHRDVYTRVLPRLQEAGIVANIAIPTDWVGQTIAGSPRLTELEIERLHDAGWSILPHGTDHADLTYMTDSELDRQLRVSQQWVRSRGYRGSDVFVVPFHRWYEREHAAVEKYYVAARGYGVDHHRYGGMVDWPAQDPYMLTSIPADGYYKTAAGRQQMEDWWAEAVSTGKFLGTYFHSIQEDDVAALEDVIERLVAFKAHIRTYADLFEN